MYGKRGEGKKRISHGRRGGGGGERKRYRKWKGEKEGAGGDE